MRNARSTSDRPRDCGDSAAPATRPATLPKHLHSLDVLRGLAALAVVFWHWQHFFLENGTHVPGFVASRQPFFAALRPLYASGWPPVELFFCLSGFIFTWLYADSIQRGATRLRAFTVLRLSRLYPLHFVTLLFVAAAQLWMIRVHGSPFVYLWNDAYHFVLQLGFAGNWGLERGDSFNGPTWSVSIEILLYALFFLTCRLGVRRWWQLAAVAAAGFALMMTTEVANSVMKNALFRIGHGVFGFYVGGIAFLAYRALWRHRPALRTIGWLAGGVAALWIVVPLLMSGWLYPMYRAAGPHTAFTVAGHDLVDSALWRLEPYAHFGLPLLVFPLTVITLALWESARGPVGERFRAIGDLSYASYLVHFPLQLVFFGVAVALGIPRSAFYHPAVLVGFFAVLIPLSVVTYRRLELPAQRLLRRRFLNAAAADRGRAGLAPLGGGAAIAD